MLRIYRVPPEYFPKTPPPWGVRLSEAAGRALDAYRVGAFPMNEGDGIEYFVCDPRSVFHIHRFHVPRSLAKTCRKRPFDIRMDTAFERVLEGCRSGRPVWIGDALFEVYLELHAAGFVHSIEAWKDGELAGGVFGTAVGAAFLAESMYHVLPNASNCCLVRLIERLDACGFRFCDVQYENPHTARFGPSDVPMEDFFAMHARAAAAPARLTIGE